MQVPPAVVIPWPLILVGSAPIITAFFGIFCLFRYDKEKGGAVMGSALFLMGIAFIIINGSLAPYLLLYGLIWFLTYVIVIDGLLLPGSVIGSIIFLERKKGRKDGSELQSEERMETTCNWKIGRRMGLVLEYLGKVCCLPIVFSGFSAVPLCVFGFFSFFTAIPVIFIIFCIFSLLLGLVIKNHVLTVISTIFYTVFTLILFLLGLILMAAIGSEPNGSITLYRVVEVFILLGSGYQPFFIISWLFCSIPFGILGVLLPRSKEKEMESHPIRSKERAMVGVAFGIGSISLLILGWWLYIFIFSIPPYSVSLSSETFVILLLSEFFIGYPGFAIIALILGIIGITSRKDNRTIRRLSVFAITTGALFIILQIITFALPIFFLMR